jgi:DNA repair protein RadC
MRAQQITNALTAVLDVTTAEAEALIEAAGGLRGLLADPSPALLELTPTRQRRLLGALELVRISSAPTGAVRVTSPQDAAVVVLPLLRFKQVEEFHAIFCDARLRIIEHRQLSVGSDSMVLVDPKEIVRAAIVLRAKSVILAHNHPSGDPEPSPQDITLTVKIGELLSLFSVTLADHLVVGNPGWVSMRRDGHYVSRLTETCAFMA